MGARHVGKFLSSVSAKVGKQGEEQTLSNRVFSPNFSQMDFKMQPVHSRNVNAHTCLGGECEASLPIGSLEPDRETKWGTDRNPADKDNLSKYQVF
ncbi:hypothetical protein ATANTOWER_007031 [Ataeniobius toweri]|uniref:Uncharacterized protein n=1 Tax=Ataeniobius toweri TaxID=208326 RepID=A0ABU7BRC0_9TELE|nr:hypothetical protein [Ataeniobius toweri]